MNLLLLYSGNHPACLEQIVNFVVLCTRLCLLALPRSSISPLSTTDFCTLFSTLIVLLARPCMGECSLMLQCLFTFVFLFLEGSGSCEMAKLWSGRKGVMWHYQGGKHQLPLKITLGVNVCWDLWKLPPSPVPQAWPHLLTTVITELTENSSEAKR